jgi:hypothetical protein
MPTKQPVAVPVLDSIPRVDDAVDVGEDLDFQRAWWRFEKIAWIFLAVVLIADAMGAFGRGWLARAERATSDGTLDVRYERVERAGTPSEMTMTFGGDAVHDGKVRLFASESVVKPLGAERVIPQPAISEVVPGGIMYTFPASGSPVIVSIALQPSFPGVHQVELHVEGAQTVHFPVAVLP